MTLNAQTERRVVEYKISVNHKISSSMRVTVSLIVGIVSLDIFCEKIIRPLPLSHRAWELVL